MLYCRRIYSTRIPSVRLIVKSIHTKHSFSRLLSRMRGNCKNLIKGLDGSRTKMIREQQLSILLSKLELSLMKRISYFIKIKICSTSLWKLSKISRRHFMIVKISYHLEREILYIPQNNRLSLTHKNLFKEFKSLKILYMNKNTRIQCKKWHN